ncbi:hypothetical protein D5013_000414, partial [Listeria monocytogenes]
PTLHHRKILLHRIASFQNVMYKSYFKGLCLNIIGKSSRNQQIIKTEAPPMPKLAFGCTPEFLFKILTN